MRKAEYYTNTSKKLRGIFLKLRLKRLQNKYFLNIPINTFDKGLKLIHLGPRLVNGKARIEKNCVMHINTCIVAGGRDNGVPTLGDNIVMGVASVVAGNVYIADNIAIGANAFVNKTFSQGDITIAGVPAKKISDYSRKDWNK